MNRFNHAYCFGFSLENNSPDGEETTAQELRAAILSRLSQMPDSELLENCGAPFDTYENEETTE
jgi:hypothetical protein